MQLKEKSNQQHGGGRMDLHALPSSYRSRMQCDRQENLEIR